MKDKKAPKIVLFDLETLPDLQKVMEVFPSLSNYPGLTLKASINSIICFGYKVLPAIGSTKSQKPKVISAWDNAGLWSRDTNDDSWLCEKIIEILGDADCVITHNGKRFDWKFLQTRLVKHKLPPLPKITHIDTCELAKRNLMTFNNRLNTLGSFLSQGQKMGHEGWELWNKVSKRDIKAQNVMAKYCAQDVALLEKVYTKLLPFAPIVAPAIYTEKDSDCPKCGHSLQNNGYRVNKQGKYLRYYCISCSSSYRSKYLKNLSKLSTE